MRTMYINLKIMLITKKKFSEIGSQKGNNTEAFKNSLKEVEIFLDSQSVELNFMRNGHQNLSREVIYGRLSQVIDNLETSQSIDSITQSKLGNKLSSIYNQLLQINDIQSIPVRILDYNYLIVDLIKKFFLNVKNSITIW